MNFAQVKGITIPQGAVKQLSQGQTTLWRKRGGVLPADYRELIGIGFDGDFHYETGEKLYGSDVITITLDNTSTTGQNVFGSYNGTASGRKNFSLFIYGKGSSSNSYLRYGETLYRPKYGTGKRTLVFGSNGTTDGFATDVTITPDTFETDVQAFIGWLPNSTSPHYTGDIVGRITVGNRLIWIPVERISDGEIGYYELNSGVFLTKTGTGTPVSLGYLLPSEYQQVEYIYSPKTTKYNNFYGRSPYLLLGIQTNFLGYDIDFQYDADNAADTPRLVGSFRWGGGNYGSFGVLNAINWAMQTGATGDADFAISYDSLRHRLQYRVAENNWLLDGVLEQSNLSTPSANSVDIGLFCTYDSAQTRPPFFATGGFKVYSAKFYSAYTLIRDLVPCYRIADSKPGMYDLVGGVFYVNQSGENTDFVVGADI